MFKDNVKYNQNSQTYIFSFSKVWMIVLNTKVHLDVLKMKIFSIMNVDQYVELLKDDSSYSHVKSFK
jgi:hypothetical protein